MPKYQELLAELEKGEPTKQADEQQDEASSVMSPESAAPVSPESKKEAHEKFASWLIGVQQYTEKSAAVIREDRGPEDEELFRGCVNACAFYKMAGYADENLFSDPRMLVQAAWNMFKDIKRNVD